MRWVEAQGGGCVKLTHQETSRFLCPLLDVLQAIPLLVSGPGGANDATGRVILQLQVSGPLGCLQHVWRILSSPY